MLSRWLYNTFLTSYNAAVSTAAFFNAKARLWKEGRRNWESRLKEQMKPFQHRKVLWMHCASLGEFEQGRPVLEAVRRDYPDTVIVLSFFSPSGYEVRKDYDGADVVCYLPMDGARNSSRFLDIVQPALAIFIKYEFWYYYLSGLKARQVPAMLVAGLFREDQPFFKSWGSLHREMLHCFSTLMVQNESSAGLLKGIGLTNVWVGGDTRFDRVISIAAQFTPVPKVAAFATGHNPVLVAGSTWPNDETMLADWLVRHPDWKLVIAPHEIHEEHISNIENLFPGSVRFSAGASANSRVLIIDNMGMLSRLYKYGRIAYVGGGFEKGGIHNMLEASVYGIPVIIGPVYRKFHEAVELVEGAAAFAINNGTELEQTISALQQEELYSRTCHNAGTYTFKHAGATQRVMHYITENRLLSTL
jgi:3-deoxy-D-manno-octulosonic-acid transferase